MTTAPTRLPLNPPNAGDAAEPNFVGRAGSFACGAVVQISLHIDDAQRIIEAKFRAAGCSVLVASTSYLTKSIEGETAGDAATLGRRPDLLTQQIGPAASDRIDCAALACAALEAAIAKYSDSRRDSWEGDEALICSCFGVSERTIEREIETRQLKTVEEVTAACNAGAGCRSCYPLIEEILGGKW